MTLSDISIQRPVLTWVMMLMMLVFGIVAWSRLGVDHYPDMELPVITILTTLEGATPQGVEEDVTDPLEASLSTLEGMRNLRSTSAPAQSSVQVEFQLGTDLDFAMQDARSEVSKARQYLPPEVDPPIVTRFNMADAPIMMIPFRSERPIVETTEYIKRHVKPLLESVPGVGGVSLMGGLERNIRIWLDSESLRARGLSAGDVIAALRREHVEVPSGFLEGARVEWSVKTDAEFRSVEELEGMLVSFADGAPVYLREVARVEDGHEDRRSLSQFNREESVNLNIRKVAGGNAVAVSDEVLRRLAEIEPLLPKGISLYDSVALDLSVPVREAVRETEFALVFGGFLAVLTVFVFLRRTRPTLIVAAAIPTSLITTFSLVYLAGFTLNTMTLLGLVLAIGIVIDDAIIVLENIERHREDGKDPFQAASDGTRQIAFAATAATISVAAVFLPVVFVEGIVGSFLSEFGLTVAGSVLISLFVALTLTPMLAARMPPPRARPQSSLFGSLERGLAALERRYRTALHWSLANRGSTLGIAVASLVVAILLAGQLDTEFLPPADQGMLMMRFEAPPGSNVEATREYMERNDEWLTAQPELHGAISWMGSSPAGTELGRTNEGSTFATLIPLAERDRTAQELMVEARRVLGSIPGQKVILVDISTMGAGAAMAPGEIELELRGNLDLAELDEHAKRFVRELQARPGFVDVDQSLRLGLPEVRVIPDRGKAATLGVDAAALSEIVQVMVGGLDVGIFKEAGNRYDIRMRLEDWDRDTPAEIEQLYVRGRDGQLVELRNLVRIETGAAPAEVTRVNRQRSVTVSANLEGKALGPAIAEAQALAAEMLPEEVTVTLAGSAEALQESAEQFFLAIVLGLIVVYLVLAAQFESFIQPFVVMLAVPFAMVGAFAGLLVSGMTLNLFSMIGILLLFGLVTKNSILLVDYANKLRAEGLSKLEAMRRAPPIRMRPVLMTGLSMILGVLPSAIGVGPGSEQRAPMAVATAAGMLSSIVLTLLVVPVVYLVIDDGVEWLRGLRK